MRRRSPSSQRWRSRRRRDLVPLDLLKSLDPAWSSATPPSAAELEVQVAELAALDPSLADFYRSAVGALTAAPDLGSLRERQLAMLGRERGAVTNALAEMPSLPVEERRRRGKGLNLVKRWLGAIE